MTLFRLARSRETISYVILGVAETFLSMSIYDRKRLLPLVIILLYYELEQDIY